MLPVSGALLRGGYLDLQSRAHERGEEWKSPAAHTRRKCTMYAATLPVRRLRWRCRGCPEIEYIPGGWPLRQLRTRVRQHPGSFGLIDATGRLPSHPLESLTT